MDQQSVKPQQPVGQSSQPVVPVVSGQPVQPISGGRGKEVIAAPTEWVAPSTPEIVLPQEVQSAGVEAKLVVPSLTKEAQQAGIKHAKESTPVTPVTEITLTMQTSHSVLMQLKKVHKSVKDSFSWLVRLLIKEQDKREKGGIN